MAKAKKIWNEVEEFYIKEHFDKIKPEELSKLLKCSEKELIIKINDLGLLKPKKKGLKGFDTTKPGIVMMTQQRAIVDDIEAGIMPSELGGVGKTPKKEDKLAKFRINKT